MRFEGRGGLGVFFQNAYPFNPGAAIMKTRKTVFLLVTCLPLLALGCATVHYDGPHPCQPYSNCSSAECIRDGRIMSDPYPEAAWGICCECLERYDYHTSANSRCVARCLIDAENHIQEKYASCSKRNAARLRAHIRCYLCCVFVPIKGIPEGGPEVGWEMLWPDFWRNPLSLW